VKQYSEKIRAIVRRLFDEDKLCFFVGFSAGSIPLANHPTTIDKAEDTDKLIWDAGCSMNLANYLHRRSDRVGVVVTGCTSRNLITLIQEHQVDREKLYIVGVPCSGMIESRKVAQAVGGKEILKAESDGDMLTVEGEGFSEKLKVADVLQRNCEVCTRHNPVLFDEMVGDEIAEPGEVEKYAEIEKIEAMDERERWDYFTDAFEECIRCYACRNACPMCYCPTCFVDENKPQWVGKTNDQADTLTFHFLRAFHLAGRCTDCGACEEACPLDIPVRYLTSKMNKDAKLTFDFESGIDIKELPLLDKYKLTDLNDFFK
jgi:formate dehydrogenase (coenzyme F420) beta subunit